MAAPTNKVDRSPSMRYSLGTLLKLVQEQDAEKGDQLAEEQRILNDLKRTIAIESKKNFTLERDILNLDKKIALLIRNRISVEEVLNSSSGEISLVNRTITLKDKRELEHYGILFNILQNDTRYIATLARLVKVNEIDNLLQTVMFTLYGNQFDDREEHLLLSMFKRVLEHDFQEAGGVGNLLRANTALTRMMTTYTRRGPGQQYLKATLTQPLTELTSQPNLKLEINPLKVYEQWLNDMESQTGQLTNYNRKPSPEEAAARPEVQSIIAPRVAQLDELATKFIDAIVGSLESVPYGIRWICKQIKDLAKEFFPSLTREQVCTLIGGFFLLRFVNPAVVTPQAFMLVDTKLSANTRRNLTLLAKILQNLANNVQFGGVKEFFMKPLNACLDRNKARLNDFLDALTRVDNLEQHLHMDKYIALGRKEPRTIHISLNELYFIHGLLLAYKDKLVAGPNDPLLEVLRGIGPAPPQLPKKENANVDLHLVDRRELEPADVAAEMTPEQLYAETKYLLFAVVKAMPQQGAPAAIGEDLNRMLEAAYLLAVSRKDSQAMDNIARIRENMRVLVGAGLISERDNYASLRRDVVQELANYEAQIAKTHADRERLEAVLKTIQEHHEFLKGQLEAYEVYLENVKRSSGPGGGVKYASIVGIQGKKDPKEKDTKAKDKDKKPANGSSAAAVKAAAASRRQPKKGPIKFSHAQLERDKIIIESEVPEDRRSNIYFCFTCLTPGTFEVTVLYKTRQINEMQLHLDELLEMQHNNQLELETEFLKLNVNLLIYLLNKSFMS